MNKFLNVALISALMCCVDTAVVVAENPPNIQELLSMQHDMVNDFTLFNVNSVSLNNDKSPIDYDKGGHLKLYNSENNINDGLLLIGEKNDDTNFKLKDYAQLDIQEKTKLTVGSGSTLKIQKDGRLTNNSILVLEDNSTLISPTINTNEGSTDFTNNRRLKHGINNENGIIKINKGSQVYWQSEQGSEDKQEATIYKGIVDFSDFFSDPQEEEFPSPDNLIMNLEGVKLQLFDTTDTRINDELLGGIQSFKNVDLGAGCTFDFNTKASASKVYKLPQDEKITLSSSKSETLSQYTVVKSKAGKINVSANNIKNLFKNGQNLQINQAAQEDTSDYSTYDLLQQFNVAGEQTIINTSYQDIIKTKNQKFDRDLTTDWSTTIQLNKLHLSKDQFKKSSNDTMNSYDIHFTFEGKKPISLLLTDVESEQDKYKINLHGDLSNYAPLINEALDEDPNVINNFVQKYSGKSPYLKTNEKTHYKVAIDKKYENRNATLRFYNDSNENDTATLSTLVVGTQTNPSQVDINTSENGKYAQNITIVDKFTMKNRASKFTLQSGQTLELGRKTGNEIEIISSENSNEDDDE